MTVRGVELTGIANNSKAGRLFRYMPTSVLHASCPISNLRQLTESGLAEVVADMAEKDLLATILESRTASDTAIARAKKTKAIFRGGRKFS